MARWIKLETWVRDEYGDDAPDPRTWRKWAQEGHLYPPAERHGKCWYVRPGTKYVAHTGGSMIDKMRAQYGTQAAQQ